MSFTPFFAKAARVRSFALLAVAAAFLSACGGAPLRIGNPQAEIRTPADFEETVVPLEAVPSFPVVEVTLNGRPGHRFILDTGAQSIVIFNHAGTRDLGLKTRGSVSVGGLGDGARPDADVFVGLTIGIGDIEMRDLTGIVLEAEALSVLGDDEDFAIDGILGVDLFQRLAVTIDDAGQELVIHAPGQAIDRNGVEIFPLERRGADYFVNLPLRAAAGTDVFQANLQLDTGDSGNLELHEGSHGTVETPTHGWASFSQGVQGFRRNIRAAGPVFIVGRDELSGFPVEIVPDGARKGEHGAVGHGLLKRFVYTVDVPGGRLILRERPGSFDEEPQGYVGLGGVPHDGGLLVSQISPDAPSAKAGLTPGIYESVNGRAFADMTWKEAAEALRGEPGDAFLICKRAEPEPDCRTVIAVDLGDPPPAN